MSSTIDDSPSIKEIADIVEDSAPHSMSELRGINFTSGNSPSTGAISLSDFRNKTCQRVPKLKSSYNPYNDQFSRNGSSTALSGDKNYFAFGVQGKDKVVIYVRSGTSWTYQTTLSIPSGQTVSAVGGWFGASVSLSYDGSQLIVGASRVKAASSGSSAESGAAYIYSRTNSSWTYVRRVVPVLPTGFAAFFGSWVEMSSDGTWAIVGAPSEFFDNLYSGDCGVVYTYKKDSSGWPSSHTQRFRAESSKDNGRFGSSISISADNNTLVLLDGWHIDSGRPAYIYTYTRSGNTFSYQSKISFDTYASSTDISGDGSYMIVGVYSYNSEKGRVFVYTRTSTGWSQKYDIIGSTTIQLKYGIRTCINYDGSYFFVGTGDPRPPGSSNWSYNDQYGSVIVYRNDGTNYHTVATLRPTNVTGDVATSESMFGDSLAISKYGEYIGVGEPGRNGSRGRAYLYDNSFYLS